MMVAPLFGAAFVIAVATEPLHGSAPSSHLTMQEKMAATESLVRSATDCIVHTVVADPNYHRDRTAQLGDLIVKSFASCLTPVRAMIDAYDRAYGDGTGEAFFMGPYLDVLPKAVAQAAQRTP